MHQPEIMLLVTGGLGLLFQWLLFGPKKVPLWLTYLVIALASMVGYAITLEKAPAGDWSGIRAVAVGFITFALQLRGAAGGLKDAKLAPPTNSL